MGDRVLLDLFPMVPLGGNLKLGVAILSYNGKISFGLVADFDAMPDLEDLADDFSRAMRELEEAAGIEGAAATDGDGSSPSGRAGAGGKRPIRQDPAFPCARSPTYRGHALPLARPPPPRSPPHHRAYDPQPLRPGLRLVARRALGHGQVARPARLTRSSKAKLAAPGPRGGARLSRARVVGSGTSVHRAPASALSAR